MPDSTALPLAFTPEQLRAFRYWIQGYQGFYEPLVAESFRCMGYSVRRPATVSKMDLERLAQDLFDGRRKAGREVPISAVIEHLRKRQRLQADALVENGEGAWLVECKSWGGFAKFDEKLVSGTFVTDPRNAAFLLLEQACGKRLAGKILVLSSPHNPAIDDMLSRMFCTTVQTMGLDEMLCDSRVRQVVTAHLEYLDAAVAEVKKALLPEQGEPTG